MAICSWTVLFKIKEMSSTLLGRYDPYRTDFLNQAEEICDFAQKMTNNRQAAETFGKEVNFVSQDKKEDRKGDKRKCFKCGKPGHLAEKCRQPKKDKGQKKGNYKEAFVLTMETDDFGIATEKYVEGVNIDCILDSGVAKHLTGKKDALYDISPASTTLMLPNGIRVHSTKKGSLKLRTIVHGKMKTITISNVIVIGFWDPRIQRCSP